MAELTWGTPSVRSHEFGISKGVIHLNGVSIPWSGLVSIDANEEKNLLKASFDGRVHANYGFVTVASFTVNAVTLPREAYPILGVIEEIAGFFLTGQQASRFDLAYRTELDESNYKLHFIHGAAAALGRNRQNTLDGVLNADPYILDIEAAPVPGGYQLAPLTHLVLSTVESDSDHISAVEDLLYGTDISDPDFPSQSDIIAEYL